MNKNIKITFLNKILFFLFLVNSYFFCSQDTNNQFNKTSKFSLLSSMQEDDINNKKDVNEIKSSNKSMQVENKKLVDSEKMDSNEIKQDSKINQSSSIQEDVISDQKNINEIKSNDSKSEADTDKKIIDHEKTDSIEKLDKQIKQGNEKENNEKKFQLNFENAALKNILDYIEDIFDVKFFADDSIGDEKKIKGVNEVKMSFKSNKALTEKQIWNFLDLILENAGLARIHMPGQDLNFYRITQIATANRSNIPIFIGTNLEELPDYQRVRYMYFVQNRQVNQLKDLLNRLQSKNAQVEIYQDLNVLIITDVAYNIKTLMKIVKELDSSGLPEILSVLKLKSADATDVARLYESLKGKEDIFRPFGEPKKAGPRLTESTKIIAEPRTNALIIFGPKESVQRLEDFIKTHVDKELDVQQTKIHVYELNYAPADQIANLLNAVVQFGAESEAAKLGGVRSGEKYLSRMYFEAEKQGNRLIIRSETDEDYKIIKKVIEELDVPQPQVAIEVFIITINLTNTKAWQSQLRNKKNETLNFQTSGFFGNGIQIDQTNNSGSLITNLIDLATDATRGSTVFTLGKMSVWAILGILQSVTDTKIIANPFLVATNKYTATVSLGQTRRIKTGDILGTGTNTNGTEEFGQIDANLTLNITPQINDYGIINLDIDVTIDNFTESGVDASSANAGNKITRKVHTNANVADQEVLALGGLIRDRMEVVQTGFPLLSKIPIIGLLFTNKENVITKDNLIIFMSPRIIKPHKELVSPYTLNKADRIKSMMNDIDNRTNKRDPVYRWFFQEPQKWDDKVVDKFIFPSEKNKGKIVSQQSYISEGKPQTKTIKTKVVQPRRSLSDCVAIKKEVVC